MQHLSLETLARLLDEPADSAEAAHLEGCAACRGELGGLRRQSESLRRLGPLEPTQDDWDQLERRLLREALIDPGVGAPFRSRPAWGGRVLRIAAAVALYAAGAGTVMALRAGPRAVPVAANTSLTRPATGTSSSAAANPATSPAAVTATPAGPGVDAGSGEEGSAQAAAAVPTNPVREVANGRGQPDLDAATPEAALASVRAAEQSYLRAYARYAELTGAQQTDDPVTRVAALESIVLTTRQALDRAPADPVINGYHLTAVAQRDAALRQIALRSDRPWF